MVPQSRRSRLVEFAFWPAMVAQGMLAMMGWPHRLKHVATAMLLVAAMALGGCGGVDGIDLNGKVFDLMGISSSALANASQNDPQLAARAPLVLPPNANRLPQPGSEQRQDQIVGLDDIEQRKVAEAKERERLHLAYCHGDMSWKETALNKEDINLPRSPYGPCPSLIGDITKNVTKN
jgi:hypothetical protein